MFHASAAFKGGYIQNFGEGGRILYKGFSILWGGLDKPLETMFLRLAYAQQQLHFL